VEACANLSDAVTVSCVRGPILETGFRVLVSAFRAQGLERVCLSCVPFSDFHLYHVFGGAYLTSCAKTTARALSLSWDVKRSAAQQRKLQSLENRTVQQTGYNVQHSKKD
jgi:hypothetical protein